VFHTGGASASECAHLATVVIPWRGDVGVSHANPILPHQDGAGKSPSAVARFQAKRGKHFCGDR